MMILYQLTTFIISIFEFKAYQAHLQTISNGSPSKLGQSILFLKHTSRMIEFFSDKHVSYIRNERYSNAVLT